ncbi:MAG: hypothetical protein GC200_07865 [Tepidisphaera sp.]|nr:hypothetical protein [Tepidisphaera sp.]
MKTALALTILASLSPAALAQITPISQTRSISGESYSTIDGLTTHQGPFTTSAPDGQYDTWTDALSIPGFISGTANQSGGVVSSDQISLDQLTLSLGGGNAPGTSAESTQSNQFIVTFNIDTPSSFTLSGGGGCAGPSGAPDTSIAFSIVFSLTGPNGEMIHLETGAENGYSIDFTGLAGNLDPGQYTISYVGTGDVSFVAPPDGAGNGAGGGGAGNFAFIVTPNGAPCDPDVNQDGVADQGDVDYLINVVAGGENPTGVNPDFNNDGVADQGDIDALVNVIAGGQCP